VQNAAGGGTSAASEYLHGAIVSDLMSLIAHVQASMELIEQAIPDEAPSAIGKLAPISSSWMTSRPVTRARVRH
jgi:hypothetical protein